VTPYRAGHVLGAAMFMVEIAGLRCLYTVRIFLALLRCASSHHPCAHTRLLTRSCLPRHPQGDYSRKADRHLPGAVRLHRCAARSRSALTHRHAFARIRTPQDSPPVPPHVLIVESTYGVATHSPKEEREKRFTEKVVAALRRGGRVLLPIVALGRAQELLLILEDYWARHPDIQHVPIYQASGLARRSLSVYQTYINMLNADMQVAFEVANPFALKHVKHLAGGGQLDDSGPCVVLATPSMLQTGLSRELFESWAGDARNGVIIADFAVQGTLARDILSDAKTVTTRSGLVVPIKCSVDAISFSAHADFPQTQAFVAELAPPHVVLVHGESVEMGRLKRALEAAAAAAGTPLHVYTPRNCQAVAIAHRGEKVARVLGRLAERAAGGEPGAPLSGVLVQKDFTYTLLHPADLAAYTKLRAGALRQRQLVPCARPFAAVRLALESLFDGIAVVRSAPTPPQPQPQPPVKSEETADVDADAVKPEAAAPMAVDEAAPRPAAGRAREPAAPRRRT
jgi:cleavage and polyadenylation specificity factor subunit 3